MNHQLEQQLFDKYPELFEQKDFPASETCMCWGITVGDGWYKLLDSLCHTITQYCQDNGTLIPQFGQVKEKFGKLRIYCDGDSDLIEGMIWMTEAMSAKTCEICGSMEDVRQPTEPNVWITTYCKKCRDRVAGQAICGEKPPIFLSAAKAEEKKG